MSLLDMEIPSEVEGLQEGHWQIVTRSKTKSGANSGYTSSASNELTPTTSTSNHFESLELETTNGDQESEMNGNIAEKIGREDDAPLTNKRHSMMKGSKAPASIREYFSTQINQISLPSWRTMPEIPTSSEVGMLQSGKPVLEPIPISPNIVEGAWEDSQQYFQSHYELLREDGVAPLRDAVAEVRAKPRMMEADSQEYAGIYENVYINGITFAPQGIAFRVEFSTRRAGKKIRWEQSKRLISGSIVALTPVDNMFQGICLVAVVAARPMEGLRESPPSIDLFFGSHEDIEVDPQKEWLMVEAKQGYYEAHRHTLRALQKMSSERFPLSEYLIDLKEQVSAPTYIQDQPFKDLRPALLENDKYINVNVLDEWPELPNSAIDESQTAALRRILTKRLAIVQGPPGTGKTHISVMALQVMLSNMDSSDPPIIVTAQTNHALDQLLRHVAVFEPQFVRLGGRSADFEIIKPRTLFEIKQRGPPNRGNGGPARRHREQLVKEFKNLIAPLAQAAEPFTTDLFKQYGLLTTTQIESLEEGAKNWIGADGFDVVNSIAIWLSSGLITVEKKRCLQDFGLEMEEIDVEYEQLKELEAESGLLDEDSYEILKGVWIPLLEKFTGRQTLGDTDQKVLKLLEQQDLWRIAESNRGAVYAYMQRKVKEEICKKFREGAARYAKNVEELKIARWEGDYKFLRPARIIGTTTTGLSKYRPLLSSLNPKIVLIEEAAETIEAHTTAACFDSLEHLILVGDHQQLRGHCAVKDLEGPPFNLDISMFERLIRNSVEYSQLTKQRRMCPEIRQMIMPIYPSLQDHPSVHGREDIPGMGGCNSYFITHTYPESDDDAMSKCNIDEAKMVIGLVDYLHDNGMDLKHITILTFYNGQRKTILNGLRRHPNLQGRVFKVATVDSYQGEENEVVILSLVRNGSQGIGFLNIDNRVCVALSRARRGFYIFGNASLLSKASRLWYQVLCIMKENPKRIGLSLPVTCSNHGQKFHIRDPSDWDQINGGCSRPCQDDLPCGHLCQLTCHPFPHKSVNCYQSCNRVLDCGHTCMEVCNVNPCECECGARVYRPIDLDSAESSFPNSSEQLVSLSAWKGPIISTAPSPRRRHRQQKKPARRSPERQPRISQEVQAYRDFANGGHRLSDALLEEKQRQKLEEIRVLGRRLLGSADADPKQKKETPTVAADTGDLLDLGNGEEDTGRKVRRSVWSPPQAAQMVMVSMDSEVEGSLLD